MLEKIARGLTRKPKLIVMIALLMLIPSVIGMAATKINYDILSYLPQDIKSAQGEALLEEPFENAATNMLIVENMPPRYTDKLLKDIQNVPGVSGAVWIGSELGIQIPADMLPAELTDVFYSGDSTMMLISYSMPGASEETMHAIDEVQKLCNKNCFLAGFSAIIKDTRDLADKEIVVYVILAVVLAFIAMSITMESWLLPLAFLGCIGLAIMYNMGTNIFMGNISYITKAIAAVLQLGVTTDYSIFLYNRYVEERAKYQDNRDAMAASIVAAFTSLSGSSLTTIAGFVALCFMRLTLGRDIGLVMAKGVVLGVATVILVLPAVLLVMEKPIEKYHHKRLMPNFNKINRFVVKHSKLLVVIFILIFLPAVYSQSHAGVYYNLDRSLPDDMPSIVAVDKLKSDYDMVTTHFIIVDDSINGYAMEEMTDRIKQVDGVGSVLSYNELLSPTIPDFFVPEEIRKIFKCEDMQLLMVNSSYAVASDEVSKQLDEIAAIVDEYDEGAYITGEAPLTKDLIVIADQDFRVTNYISIAAIFVIIMVVFKSITVPAVLVAGIELAIYINEGVPYYTGSVIPFIAPTIIGCVQLGATVDYAILMTTRFREEIRNGLDRKEAIVVAATTSDSSIITSCLVLFCATCGVGLVSKIELISSICVMLARGALISAVVSIFILPSLLVVLEPVFNRTSLQWRKVKVKTGKHEKTAVADNKEGEPEHEMQTK